MYKIHQLICYLNVIKQVKWYGITIRSQFKRKQNVSNIGNFVYYCVFFLILSLTLSILEHFLFFSIYMRVIEIYTLGLVRANLDLLANINDDRFEFNQVSFDINFGIVGLKQCVFDFTLNGCIIVYLVTTFWYDFHWFF